MVDKQPCGSERSFKERSPKYQKKYAYALASTRKKGDREAKGKVMSFWVKNQKNE